MNRLSALLIVSLGVALPAAAAATDDVCWNRDTERMDFYTNQPSRGDNNFFSFTVSGTANVTMIYPNTLSMRQLPISLYELRTLSPPNAVGAIGTRGCSNTTLNNLDYFMPSNIDPPVAPSSCLGKYDPGTQYPEPDMAYAGGGGTADSFESGAGTTAACPSVTYNANKTDHNGGLAWEYALWPADATAGTSFGSSPNVGSIDGTCAAAVGASSGSDYQDCQQCVQNKGYWVNYNKSINDTTGAAFVAKGNWLNFFPPKWAILHLGYHRLVNGPLLNPLREGIGTQNGATGWYRLQKMLPQSCSGQGRPNQRLASVDGLAYNNSSNPLAEMLFNVAWTVSSQGGTPPASWGFFTSGSTHPASEAGPNSQSGKKAGFCPGCNAGFSVLFSDGRGLDGLQNCDSSQYLLGILDPSFPAYCKDGTSPYLVHDSKAACSLTAGVKYPGLGTEQDGDDYLAPSIVGGAQIISQSGGANYLSSSGVCPNDWLPNVASWMFATDLASNSNLAANDVPGTNLRLYTVGIGDNYFGELNTLSAAASAGHGLFLSASNFAALERNITKVFLDIISNATSFSVAAITTVQTRGTTFAFIPRFRPLGGSQWEGRLYRFRLYNEFAAGCGPAELTGGPDGGPVKDALNPNGNASCNDLYLQDADGGFVGEDDGGTFVLLDNSQAFDPDAGGWPAKSPKTSAVPIWEAAALLTTRENTVASGGSGATARVLLTVPLDAGIPAAPTTLISFNDYSGSGSATITDYLKLSGVNSDFCVGMSSTSRHVYATQTDCGVDLIKFIEGRDVLRQNTDGGTARPNILGDIFHSSPILVTPPAPTFLCETGIISQCVRTLYAEDTAGGFTKGSKTAYNTYFAGDAGTRQEIIMVGANDGMVHAFQAGTSTGDGGYDDGTGQEVWAFIPPDMLPKLQRYALSQSHSILMDGTPWVRDIWKDGSGATSADHQKQYDEFHTIAIIGEREGGRHYTAIDVTDTTGNPKFLWTWPPPGSPYDLSEGESWNDTTPNPPPIGPVLIADSPPSGTGITGGNSDGGVSSERWVVAISGGYDPNLVRGRAIYILDAYDGTLLYKFSRYDTTSSSDPRYNLGSVAAPVSLVDTNFDNFFDLAVVGDTDGQLFSIDMLNPGTLSGSPSLVSNWYGGMTFQQFKGGAMSQRQPFFTMAGARVFDDSKGGTRVYLGGGDRDQIKVRDTDTADGGTCTLDNLRGCIRNNCTVDVNQAIYQVGQTATGFEAMTGHWNYAPNGTALATNTFTYDGGVAGSAGSCSDYAQVNVQYQIDCNGTKLADPNDGGTILSNTVWCDFDGGNDGGEECIDTHGKDETLSVAFTNFSTIKNSEFYSVKIFDAPNYTNRPRMTNTTTQSTYNSNTLTQTNLTDVSTDAGISSSAAGWYLKQTNDLNEKTASAALLLGGCVAWNTEVPSVIFSGIGADGGTVCKGGTIPADTAYLYQANDDTGLIQCGLTGSNTQLATARFQQRSVTVTPQQPTPVVSLNAKTGQAGYSGVSLEPGGKIPLQISVGAASVQGDVSWLDVSRTLHNCRHPADGGTPVCN